jgi:hypothetical protein
MTDFDDLFVGANPNKPWLSSLTGEPLDWVHELAAMIREEGREPSISWMELHRRFAARFPDNAPNGHQTLRDNVRRLVAQ